MKNNTNVAIVSLLISGGVYAQSYDVLGVSKAQIVYEELRQEGSQQYQYVKYVDNKGNHKIALIDKENKQVSIQPHKYTVMDKMDDRLRELVSDDTIANAEKVVVEVKLKTDVPYSAPPIKRISGETYLEDGSSSIKINDQEMNEEQVKAKVDELMRFRKKESESIRSQRKSIVDAFLKKNNLASSKLKQGLGSDSFILSLTKKEVVPFLEKNKQSILSISIPTDGGNELANAMVDTSVTNYALSYSTGSVIHNKGNGVNVFVADIQACPPPELFPYKYTKPRPGATDDENHEVANVSVVRAVSPEANIACVPMTLLQAEAQRAEGSDILTCSTGERNVTGAYKSEDAYFDQLAYEHGVAVFKSAGNEGEKDGWVTSPGKGHNVITVGNYGGSGSSRVRHATSSYINSYHSKNEKPEIMAPGTHLLIPGVINNDVPIGDSERGTQFWTGTSFAAPHAAAFLADLMSDNIWLKGQPALAKAFMMAGATHPVDSAGGTTYANGVNSRTGVGAIDYYDTAYSEKHELWVDSNPNSFEAFAASDVIPTNGDIDWVIPLQAGKDVRIVIVWLNNGNYTTEHKLDTDPIGMDLDLYVKTPFCNGISHQYSSTSANNGFEVVNFRTKCSGDYDIRIDKWSKNDVNAIINIAAVAQWK